MKSADQILKTHPNHGETLAMKGLVLSYMEKKDEAAELIKLGLRNNLRSSVCWHVFGLMHRSNRDYAEAVKSYLNALRIDKDNLQILRDLSLLQIQIRDLEGFKETRRQILVQKSNNRANWLGYAVGSHLAGDLSKAVEILQSYEGTIEAKQGDYEHSELLLYKNDILTEMNDPRKALDHLIESEPLICDQMSLLERKAKLLSDLGDNAESLKIYEKLLDLYPENRDYHIAVLQSISFISSENVVLDPEGLSNHFDKLELQFPKVNAVQRLPLDYLDGQKFTSRVNKYLQNRIRKGIPSLFRDIKPLLKISSKKEIITELINGYISSLKANGSFKTSSSVSEINSESPSSLLWTLYFAAQLWDFFGDHSKALDLINEAITHTPTALDLYLAKARIYKHAGDAVQAYFWADAARKMDLADRYLNTISVKYAWRAGKVSEAETTALLFLREGDGLENLTEMQASWYELAAAQCHFDLKDYGKALKFWKSVQRHFDDIHEDQFDFHAYCLRKVTLRSYLSMLKYEDRLRESKEYQLATGNIVKTYLHLHDLKVSKGENPVEKLLEKSSQKKGKKSSKNVQHITPDPMELELINVPCYLEEAAKHIRLLELYCPLSINSHILATEVYLLRGKLLLACRAILKAIAISADHPEIPLLIVKFARQVSGASNLHNVADAILKEQLAILLEGKTIDEFISHVGEKAVHALQLFACAKIALELNSNDKITAVKFVTSASTDGLNLKECIECLEFLEKLDDQASVELWRKKCINRFPLCPIFNKELNLNDIENPALIPAELSE